MAGAFICDPEGKIAIYGCETEAYKRFFNDNSLQQVKAMRKDKTGNTWGLTLFPS